jgi:hypothetical protein
MEDDELGLYQHSSASQQANPEPLDVSILRHSIAAALGTPPADHSSDSEVLQFSDNPSPEKSRPDDDHRERPPLDPKSSDEKRRSRSLRLSAKLDKTESQDRSLRVEDMTSITPNRSLYRPEMTSSGYFRDTEYTKALWASEKAKRILESPYLTKKRDILSESGLSFGTPRQTRKVGRVDISDIRGVSDHVERLKKPPPKPEPEPDFVILPNPPDITPSFKKVSTILTTEIDDIIGIEDVPM